ncbi:MAG: GNAT family N-acetyltransferase, partial [Actinomycetota bacterium]|nr:GNAT family N-acetyltransferase [Actinomycetota bacterium]
AEAASTAYELVDLPNPAPDELVADLLELHLAMNDEPLDDLQLDDAVWPEERFRAFEQAMTARGCRLHRLLARRRSDGVLGGHTVVVVEDDRPWVGFQEDTAVIAGHRGHKLGLRLKIAMLHALADREPQLRHIDTWNAESNTYMIAVNDAIGCVVVGRGIEVQHTLTP